MKRAFAKFQNILNPALILKFLIALVVGLMPLSASRAMTRNQAEAIVLAQVIAPSPYSAKLVAYSYPTLVVPGNFVQPNDFSFSWPIFQDTWFFWIDYVPGTWFVHPAAFVFVDATTGAITTMDVKWWPLVNGTQQYGTYVQQTA